MTDGPFEVIRTLVLTVIPPDQIKPLLQVRLAALEFTHDALGFLENASGSAGIKSLPVEVGKKSLNLEAVITND